MVVRRVVLSFLGVFLCVGVAGCAQVDEGESFVRPPVEVNSGDGEGGGVDAQSGDVQMSGRYRVGGDGRLLRPEDAPIPSKPQYPDEARFETPEGAEAFVRYVIDLYEYMLVSGETTDFEKLCRPASQWCSSLANKRIDIRRVGGWIELADIEILKIQFPFEIEGHPGLWNSDIEVRRNKLTGYNKGKLQDEGTLVMNLRLQMRFENGRWGIESSSEVS